MNLRHPAHLFEPLELLDGLERAIELGHVSKHKHPSWDLVLYNYTQACVYDKAWANLFNIISRGLVLTEAGGLVATPFPKFFNLGELGAGVPSEPFEAFEKMDGSLGIIFYYRGKWFVCTRGSFVSEQARWAQKFLNSSDLSPLTKGTTYLVEILYPENRIVIDYRGCSGLVLLAAYDAEGYELSYREIRDVASSLPWTVPVKFEFETVADAVAASEKLDKNEEGFVIRFTNGYRIKIKGAEYLRIHKAISRLTPLAVWEMLEAGDDCQEMRKNLPEEFWADFDTILNILETKAARLVYSVVKAHAATSFLSDKELGLRLDTFDPGIARLLFPFRKKHGNILGDARIRKTLFKDLRPDNNRLEGYVPTSSMARQQSLEE
jgi:putative RNA ligase